MAAIGALPLLGIKIPSLPGLTSYGLVILLLIAPSVIKIAVWSGDDFEVTFLLEEAKKEEERAAAKLAETDAPVDAARLEEIRLNSYYEINQAQARSAFRWAILMMILGFGTIIAGIWLFYIRPEQSSILLTALSTVAGIISNLISGLFLHLHHRTQDRSLDYFGELARVQRVRLAITVADNMPSNEDKANALRIVVASLLEAPPRSKTEKGS